jgi:hypothetical protein
VIRMRKTKRNCRIFLVISLALEASLFVMTRLIAPIDKDSP